MNDKQVDDAVFSRQSITLDAAERVLQAARRKAQEIGVPMTIAVVDESGIVSTLARMDGASFIGVDAAIGKARTAAALRAPTHGLFRSLQNSPAYLTAIAAQPGIVLLEGGLPLQREGKVIGAVGVSGGNPEQDITVAEAGVAVF